MALPTLKVPTFFLNIPSTGKEIKYRPFLVKEEKILLIAMQETGEKVIYEAVKQIIINCTFGAIDVDKLTTFDIEYLFLQIRIKSKGNMINLTFTCQNLVPNPKGEGDPVICKGHTDIEYDLENVKLINDPDHKKKIMLSDTIGMILKYPTLETSQNVQAAIKSDDYISKIYHNIRDYVDTIFDGEIVYDDFTAEEFDEFIEGLSKSQFQMIRDFFRTLPRLRGEVNVKCPKCGNEEIIVLEGLQNFLE